MKKRVIFSMFFLLALVVGFEFSVYIRGADKTFLVKGSDMDQADDLIIVTQDEVRRGGYPKNKFGETYGPDVYEIDNEPDLILVENDEKKQGYVRLSDINKDIHSIEEALQCNEETKKQINMYLQDGRTCIGKFSIGF